ncbi:LysR family transcriptional regulator [Pseudosulfitobacter sp. DSM 107133]|uniref:LysR family transcriptional regulator n=1 Tax=Pseudosulfitobacter sp. DSM 107133 TaxID=2883100 RepID=UPI000DF45B53|nr:LysR family transcriptional regulator [Pseudosulfitobacter sp. DSM 107133]UOA29490.1 HTH-type transcriptional activator CmpR [Pseudosulfitobacter sp. DSM 107133]
MTGTRNSLDWTYIRAFLAVAETGSLTAAAQQLGQSQPTLGRHIKAAEAAVGAELFLRTPNGLQLTDIGRMMLEPARDMAGASARLETLAAGRDTRLSGTVRLTASVVVSNETLPQIIADLRIAEPDIEIELVPSDTTENLIFREADIAIRMFRPTQLDIVTRKIADRPMALYATPGLLARYGQPDSLEQLQALPFVGFDRSDLILRYFRETGFDVTRNFFGVRCDDQATFWKLVCAGCGVGAMQTVIGDAEPKVSRLDFQSELPALSIWLAAHQALYQSPRIKRVWDFLAERLV